MAGKKQDGAVNVGSLKPADYNPRRISAKALEMLGKSLKEFGDLGGIVFNRRTGRIVGGHQRVKHLDPKWPIVATPTTDETGTVAHGYIDTPFGRLAYREVDWDQDKEMLANIAANRHGGEFDYPRLKDLLVELDTGAADMELSGFDGDALQALFAYGTEEDKGEAEEEIERAIKDIGQPKGKSVHWVWVDCRSEEEMEALIEVLGKNKRELDPDRLINVLVDAGMWPEGVPRA